MLMLNKVQLLKLFLLYVLESESTNNNICAQCDVI